jgi:hypothetical protein
MVTEMERKTHSAKVKGKSKAEKPLFFVHI